MNTRQRHTILEWCVEKLFMLVASFSLISIFLIMLFIIREALPVFVPDATVFVDSFPSEDITIEPEVYNLVETEKTQLSDLQQQENKEIVLERLSRYYEQDSIVINRPQASQMLATAQWDPKAPKPLFGIISLFIGTLKITLLALLIASPLGVFTAMYCSVFLSHRLREIIKPIIELLAGIPSVVIGFFCLTVLSTFLQSILGLEFRLNALVGGIGLAIAIVPIIFSITEDTLAAIPRSLRESSLALGATEWQTLVRVILPTAFPGIFSAILLGFGRAFGETMIVIMATGNATILSAGITEPIRTVAGTIGIEMGEVVWGSMHYHILFFLGAVLFVGALFSNIVIELILRKTLHFRLQHL